MVEAPSTTMLWQHSSQVHFFKPELNDRKKAKGRINDNAKGSEVTTLPFFMGQQAHCRYNRHPIIHHLNPYQQMPTPYHALTVWVLSQHDKTPLLQAALTPSLGWQLCTDADFDTDQLGSFTGERPRVGDQQQAAVQKATLACHRNQARFGLGSEGSFGPHPSLPGVMWGLELVAFYDADQDAVVVGRAEGISPFQRQQVQDLAEAEAFLTRCDFPSQWLNLYQQGVLIAKGISTREGLFERLSHALSLGPCELETDYRAHACPARRQLIAKAASDLATRLQRRCPSCQAVDFSPVTAVSGLVCEACSLPTPQIKGFQHQCRQCHHQQFLALSQTQAPVSLCPFCNP